MFLRKLTFCALIASTSLQASSLYSPLDWESVHPSVQAPPVVSTQPIDRHAVVDMSALLAMLGCRIQGIAQPTTDTLLAALGSSSELRRVQAAESNAKKLAGMPKLQSSKNPYGSPKSAKKARRY